MLNRRQTNPCYASRLSTVFLGFWAGIETFDCPQSVFFRRQLMVICLLMYDVHCGQWVTARRLQEAEARRS